MKIHSEFDEAPLNQLGGEDPLNWNQVYIQAAIGAGSGIFGAGIGFRAAKDFVAANRPATSAATDAVIRNALSGTIGDRPRLISEKAEVAMPELIPENEEAPGLD